MWSFVVDKCSLFLGYQKVLQNKRLPSLQTLLAKIHGIEVLEVFFFCQNYGGRLVLKSDEFNNSF